MHQGYAFDLLSIDGDDLRELPFTFGKTSFPACWRDASAACSSPRSNRARSGGPVQGRVQHGP
jgi:hypothetical protein